MKYLRFELLPRVQKFADDVDKYEKTLEDMKICVR